MAVTEEEPAARVHQPARLIAPAEAEEAAVYMEASGKTDWQTSLIILLAEAEEAVAVLDRKIMEPEATVEGTTRMERPALWERV